MRRVFSGRSNQVEEAERAVKTIEEETRWLWFKIDMAADMRNRVGEGSGEYREWSRKLYELDEELQVKERLRADMIARVDRLKAGAGGGGLWMQAVKRVGSAWRSERGRGDAMNSWPKDPRFVWSTNGATGPLAFQRGPDLGRHVWPVALETGPGLGRHVGPVAAEVSSTVNLPGGRLGDER
jgi:hypothetical protein